MDNNKYSNYGYSKSNGNYFNNKNKYDNIKRVQLDEIKKDFSDTAENVIKNLNRLPNTSQIRNVLDLINNATKRISVLEGEDISEYKDDLLYIRVKLAYIEGKASDNDGVKDFIEYSNLKDLIKTIVKNNKKSEYLVFAKYVEALVAYHKFYGGRD